MNTPSVWVALALLSGCVAQPVLIPDSAATLAPGSEKIAVDEDVGVRVYVNGDAWRHNPPDLAEVMTPLRVTIENRGSRPVRISYAEVSLLGASGFRYPALAPMTGQPPVSQLPRVAVVYAAAHDVRRVHPPPRFDHHGFLIARHYHPLYPEITMWSAAFPYDPYYYQRYQDVWPAALPTEDMLSEALPEGVLESGGRVSGFIYFQPVSREKSVRFEMRLVDASSGDALGLITVPFVVGRR